MTEQLAFLQGYRYTWPALRTLQARGTAGAHTILPSQQPMYRTITALDMLA